MRALHILLLCVLGAALLSSVVCNSRSSLEIGLFSYILCPKCWITQKCYVLFLQMGPALMTAASGCSWEDWTKP